MKSSEYFGRASFVFVNNHDPYLILYIQAAVSL
jgi:hypothetical protein